MKKHTCIPTLLALVFLANGCTLPPVHDPSSRPDKETTTGKSSQPEKPAQTAHPETKGKRVSLIPQEKAAQTVKETPPDKGGAPAQEAQPAPPQPPPQPQAQIFTDYNTGLIFTYPRPWRVVSTQGEGSILGRDGQSQLTTRFVTLTADKDKSSQRGYFYAPEDSLTGTIGKTLKSILGIADKQAAPGKPPIDVLLTQKHFPNLIIEKRYRGNNGGVIVQKCRNKQLPGSIQVYHIFIGDKAASFSLAEVKNRQVKLEMQQIVLSTKKP
ncbi:MAG: hypothetical protein WCZ86_01940 [Desulfurivibrionaceae bacterium]